MAGLRRIVVLGCAGAGKTTFARKLAARIGAPAIVLDELWPPGSTQDVAAFRERIGAAHAGETWVSDGNFALATFDLRLPRADVIVWIERPLLVCAWRAGARVFARGEAHRIGGLWRAWRFICNFDRVNRPRIEAARLSSAPHTPVLHLHTDEESDAFIALCAA